MFLASALASSIGYTQAPRPDDGPHRLNILLITADDLGLQLSSYGELLIETAHLDSLAMEGARFEVAYATQASCSPSRSSIFTGLYPHATGQYGLTNTGTSLHPHLRSRTIPALLKSGGYRTGLIGKLHVEPSNAFPFDFRRSSKVPMREVRWVAQTADRFLRETGEAPFFLMISFADPHASFGDECKQCGFPPQVDGLPAVQVAPTAEVILPFQQVDAPSQRVRSANYYNSILRLDEGVGMLLEVLEQHGHADNTLVIFIGDHGPPFARGKTTTYEAGLRIPFIVRWPGVSRPIVSRALVSGVDILPTILDAADLPIPGELHGRSLRPLVSDPDALWRQYLVGEFHLHGPGSFFPQRSIRNDRFKLIHNLQAGRTKRPMLGVDGDKAFYISREERYTGTLVGRAFETFADPPEFELYDLETDPVEFINLAGAVELETVQQELTLALMDWRRQTEDPFLEATFMEEMAQRFGGRSQQLGRTGTRLAVAGALLLVLLIIARRHLGLRRSAN